MSELQALILKLDLQYDGSHFHGWSKQPGLTTVQGCLEEALTTVLGVRLPIRVAGRTDAGVHARHQVASVELPGGLAPALEPRSLRRSLNALVPQGLTVIRTTFVPAPFDARRDTMTRCYRYFLSLAEVQSPFLARYSWHVGPGLDLRAMEAATSLLPGRHDLTAFTPAETEHVFFRRRIERCNWGRAGTLAWLEVEAESFLRHMVRVLVGTLVEVGRGRRDHAGLASLLAGGHRSQAGPTAPPHGLFLWRVSYTAGKPDRQRGVSAGATSRLDTLWEPPLS